MKDEIKEKTKEIKRLRNEIEILKKREKEENFELGSVPFKEIKFLVATKQRNHWKEGRAKLSLKPIRDKNRFKIDGQGNVRLVDSELVEPKESCRSGLIHGGVKIGWIDIDVYGARYGALPQLCEVIIRPIKFQPKKQQCDNRDCDCDAVWFESPLGNPELPKYCDNCVWEFWSRSPPLMGGKPQEFFKVGY